MDKQARELEQVAETERVDDGIIVTMKDKILFDFNSAELKSGSRAALQKMADVFKKYDKTDMTVTGHTDNVGTASYNLQLSNAAPRRWRIIWRVWASAASGCASWVLASSGRWRATTARKAAARIAGWRFTSCPMMNCAMRRWARVDRPDVG